MTDSCEIVHGIKGFDRDLKCRGFQFEIGQTYTYAGNVIACQSGFHAICGNPMEVFEYYAPAGSRYTVVSQSGNIARHQSDSKTASATITIGVELHLHDLGRRAIKWITDHAKSADVKHAEGDLSAASATGYRSAASATGDRSAASTTGDRSAASATGDRSAASTTGDRSAASTTGNQSAASATGNQSAAMSSGRLGRAMAAEGCALFLVYRDVDWNITHAWAGIAGRDGIKPLVWYSLDANGHPQECE